MSSGLSVLGEQRVLLKNISWHLFALHLNLPLVIRDRKIQSLEEIKIIW